MERCPNCGQQSREGAKFCTACGAKMAEAEVKLDEEPDTGAVAQASNSVSDEHASEAGWPRPDAPADASSQHVWAPAPASGIPPEPAPGTSGQPENTPSSTWPSAAGDAWPAPPSTDAPDPALHAVETAPSEPRGETDLSLSESSEARNGADGAAMDHITRLLDELRDAVLALEGRSPVDFSAVIADLDVAVTPPGAIDPETLSELRDALLTARETPRDIDTIIALTSRLDALVALVFAYDRTIAAIERALEVLRRA